MKFALILNEDNLREGDFVTARQNLFSLTDEEDEHGMPVIHLKRPEIHLTKITQGIIDHFIGPGLSINQLRPISFSVGGWARLVFARPLQRTWKPSVHARQLPLP